jgi:large subunit ribosomal protein L6
MPVVIPDGVKIEMVEDRMKVTGPKGTLEQTVRSVIQVNIGESEVVMTRPDDRPDTRALHGLTRALDRKSVV